MIKNYIEEICNQSVENEIEDHQKQQINVK